MSPLRSTVSRRSILGASIAVAAAALPVASLAVATPAAAEVSPLAALAAAFDRLTAEAGEIEAERRRVAAAWRDRWPLAADEISRRAYAAMSETELDILGDPLVRPGERHARALLDVGFIQADLEEDEAMLRRARAQARRAILRVRVAHGRRCVEAWEAYEAARADILARSGMAALDDRAAAVRGAIHRQAREILAAPATSLEDFSAQAKAVDALGLDGVADAIRLVRRLAALPGVTA
jgi:hypothetical protein